MKRMLSIVVLLLMSSIALAQNKTRQHVAYDLAQLQPEEYMHDRFYVRLRPEYKSVFNGPHARTRSFSSAGNGRRIQPLAAGTNTDTRSARLGKEPAIDLGLYKQVVIGPGEDLQEVMNEMGALGVADVIEPVFIPRMDKVPNDPRLDEQYYLTTIKAFDAWDITEGSEEVVIAIVDSGIELNHDDLKDRIYYNTDEVPGNGIDDDNDGYVDNYAGWDFCGADINSTQPDGDPNLVNGPQSHGIEVAGCAVATSDNGFGIAGVAPRTKILALKHTYDNQEASDDGIYFAYQGVIYAAQQGADIINCSWGGGQFSQIGQDIITSATVDMGALVVASAGNADNDQPHYPSDYRYALSIASTDEANIKSDFSSFGKNVDLTAPGSDILTTTFNNRFTFIGGTSFSAPIAAAGAALVKAVYPQFSGMQLGEMIRVTANPDFYLDNLNYEGLLGSGIMDLEAALTTRSPALRLESVDVVNAAGEVPQAGDDAFVVVELINYLFPTSGTARAILSSESDFITVDRTANQFRFGTISMLGTATNELSPFKMKLDDNIPENTQIEFAISYVDGAYEDIEYFTLLVNPTYLNITDNLVATTMTSKGRVGYNSDGPGEGLGFVYDDTEMLFEMGLMVGSSETNLVNTLRPATAGAASDYDDDFTPTSKITETPPGTGERSYAEVYGSFDDRGAGGARIGLEVDYTSLVWNDEGHDKYVVVEYVFKNKGTTALEDLYAGLFADWDILGPDDVIIDKAEWYAQGNINLGYVVSKFEDTPMAGIQLLTNSGAPNYFAIQNDESWPDTPWGLYDGYTDAEKFLSLSGGTQDHIASGNLDSTRSDVSHVVSAGPFTIPAEDSVVVAFAVHAADNFDELVAAANNAWERYNLTLNAPVPVAEDVVVCYGEAATLTASGDPTSFNWYAERFEGEPFATGTNQVTTGPLLSDTTFYVSNADNAYESVRVPVHVTVNAQPVVNSQGDVTAFCAGDSLLLFAEEADGYLWEFPDGSQQATRSIYAKTPGSYQVTVTTNDPACESTSPAFSVSTIDKPKPSFSLPAETVSLCLGLPVDFGYTGSGDAVSFFWRFGDNKNSTERDPSHVYATAGTFNVVLEVSNESGCAADSTAALVVENDRPDANFSYDQVASAPPLSVQFDNSSTKATTYQWDFGDGNSSGEEEPQHQYANEGSFTVRLRALNDLGCADSVLKNVTVVITALEDALTGNQFRIYPNPSGKYVFLDWAEDALEQTVNIRLYNASGRVLMQKTVTTDQQSEALDISHLSSGVYMLSIDSDILQRTYRIVKP